jgi:uncharacterized protein (TIGR01319 family)
MSPQSGTAGAEPTMATGTGQVFLITDCGSTTTKAVLIAPGKDGYRLVARGESPTTLAAPVADVVVGVLNAVAVAAESCGRQLLTGTADRLLSPASNTAGSDVYLSTSSAGGGLQMLVMGVVDSMTAASAERAALGAGAIVTDVIAFNDTDSVADQLARLRQLRPDMILLSGGVDGGSTDQVCALAELIALARPRPRLVPKGRLPVIFAGNRDAREAVAQRLGEVVDLVVVDNLRPVLEEENLAPARGQIHAQFMEHVMARAPGYRQLLRLCDVPVLPTPAAVGKMIQQLAVDRDQALLAIDVGGATTDVFTAGPDQLDRTVSANLGLSYSIAHVCREAGWDAVARWLPFALSPEELRNRVKNKMIRPTTLPESLADLALEQAVAREAIRLAFAQHRTAVTPLRGVQKSGRVADAFATGTAEAGAANIRDFDLILGSGGVIAHAPRRQQAALMLIDALQPVGVTELVVDSGFLLPHLGALTAVSVDAVRQVLVADCLLPLGVCVAPLSAPLHRITELAQCRLTTPDGCVTQQTLQSGELRRLPLPAGEEAELVVTPSPRVDLGVGRGRQVRQRVRGGTVGIILDGRGRPLILAADPERRQARLRAWYRALDLYPEEMG